MKKLFASLVKDKKSIAKSEDPFLAQQYLFGDSRPSAIFDVGAYIGQISQTYREIFPDAMIYCFEPFPDSFQKLVKLSADQGFKTYQLAVSDHTDKTKLYVNADVTCNSFFPRPNDGTRYYPEKARHIDRIEVDTTTIDGFCKAKDIEQIDILKLDVEGAEIKALTGADEKLSNCAISLIYAEVMFTPHYEGGCLYHELVDFLGQYGYTLFNFYNLKSAKNGQLRWGNAIFLSPQRREQIEAA